MMNSTFQNTGDRIMWNESRRSLFIVPFGSVKQVTGSCFTQPMRSDFEQIRKSDHFNQVVKMVKLETGSFRKVVYHGESPRDTWC